MMSPIARSVSLASIAFMLWGSALAQQQTTLAIQGATVIDGNGGAPILNATVIIEGNRITAVGPDVAVPAGAQIIDAAGKFVIPGMIDAKSNHASNFNEAYLVWGVTSAIISGASGDPGVAERDAINHGVIRGPRLFTSYAAVSASGMDTGIPSRYRYVVTTPEQARELSNQFFDAGADFISAADGAGAPEIYAAMVEVARERGRASVMRSVGPLTAARELADMGANVAIHAGNPGIQVTTDAAAERWKDYIALPPDPFSDMDDAKARELATYLAERNLALEPDIIAMDRGFPRNWARLQQENAQWYAEYLANPALQAYFPHVQAAGYVENTKSPETYLDAEALDLRRRAFENKMRFLKMFYDAGGRLLAASDIPQSPPGLGVHQEVAVFVEDVGVSNMDALMSVTGWAADSFMLADLGRIAPGKLADLIILDGDPLADILNTRRISAVIKDGAVVDRTYHADALEGSFRIGMLETGGCCFSSPVIESEGWTAALKQAAWRPDSRNGGFSNPGGFDSAIAPTPGIEGITPYVINQGSTSTQVTITGFNFVAGSVVLVNGQPVPTQVHSRTEIEATLSVALLRNAGRYVLRVRNPAPVAGDWGDTSNPAKITVPYSFTTTHSQNRF